MKRFYASVVLLLVCCLAAIVGSICLGHFRRTSSLAKILFSAPDGSLCRTLCLIGVEPDQSDMFATLRALSVLKQLEFYTPNSPGDRVEGYQANAIRIQASEQRQWIEVQFAQNFAGTPPTSYPLPEALKGDVSLAEVIAVFGPPEHVLANSFLTARNGRSYSQSGILLFFRRDRYLAMGIVLTDSEKLDMTAALSYLSVTAASQTGLDLNNLQHLPPWQGFVTIDRYRLFNH
ncbi:MAG TPA: hypothetical protein VKQ72_09550 [Aggregatilineales bacterium]|nr:hypothetical protein [Aggregatilineales bacterium]